MSKNFSHRYAFGAWINDTRNSALPTEQWPSKILDDETEDGIRLCLDLQKIVGFNGYFVFGLFATYAWNPDIPQTVDSERMTRVKRIIDYAHETGIKINLGLGVYSWGFDAIIANDPAVQGTNPHAMCLSSDASWQWMKKILDYILDNYEFDGFHLEASDQGRCHCPKCAHYSDFAYYSRANTLCADYIRSKKADAILLVNACGYKEWGTYLDDEADYQEIIKMSGHIDCFIDNGNLFGGYIHGEYRKRIVKDIRCAFGTSGGSWFYMPQRWDKLRWFLPYVKRTCNYLKDLYIQGGRAVEFYMGATINPGCEMNIYCGGRILSDPGLSVDDLMFEAAGELYGPDSPAVQQAVADLFSKAEEAYYDSWNKEFEAKKFVGEISIEPLFGTEPGIPHYLDVERRLPWKWVYMTPEGRLAYKSRLNAILETIPELITRVREKEKMARIITCVKNVITDIDSFGD